MKRVDGMITDNRKRLLHKLHIEQVLKVSVEMKLHINVDLCAGKEKVRKSPKISRRTEYISFRVDLCSSPMGAENGGCVPYHAKVASHPSFHHSPALVPNHF